MKRLLSFSMLLVCALALAAPSFTQEKKDLGRARISLYRVAPGKHLDLLKWFAAREDVDKEAGIPATQIYAHTDGDAWDFMTVAPVTTSEQDKKADEIAKKKGLATGFAAGLEFRQYMAWHSDTFVVGPTSASDLVSRAK